MTKITDAKILVMATDGYERAELVEPREKLTEQGAAVYIAAPDTGSIRSWDKTDWGDSVNVDLKIEDVNVDDYDAIVLPGGQINPDKLRTDKTAIAKIREFVDEGKIVAAICHAPWLLIEAGVVSGREMTSFNSIKTDVLNAGGHWKDDAVVTSNGIITSRNPGDIPAFVAKIVEEIQEGEHERDAA